MYVVRDPRSLATDMSSTQTELEESYGNRRESDVHADRLQLRDELRREQANYRNAELVHKSLEAAIRQVNVKFEEAAAFVQPAGHQLIADRQRRESDIATLNFDLEDAQRARYNRSRRELRRELRRSHENRRVVGIVNGSPRARIREWPPGPSNITAIQGKLTEIADVEARLEARQHDF